MLCCDAEAKLAQELQEAEAAKAQADAFNDKEVKTAAAKLASAQASGDEVSITAAQEVRPTFPRLMC